MARIRTIKPEFPQSESMGRVSREARLCFILLWTLADDSGRLRGNSRMLASLLYPYDNDAPRLIDKWMTELVMEKCVVRYQYDGQSYVQICNWLTHQKIDKPTPSRIPAFDESSRILANPRESSSLDQGRDQGEEGKGGEQIEAPQASPLCVKRFQKPTIDEVRAYCQERKNRVDPQAFVDFYQAKDWKIGKNPMKDWQAAVRTWEKRDSDRPTYQQERREIDYPEPSPPPQIDDETARKNAEILRQFTRKLGAKVGA